MAHHLAELNVSRAVAPLDDPVMQPFIAQLDEINALAERAPGFVWRLQGGSGNATDLRVGDDPLVIVNLTVWETIDDLFAFTYRSAHRSVFARRREWFERGAGPGTVLWWQPAGITPDLADALRRLEHLAAHGPTEIGFTFKHRLPPPA